MPASRVSFELWRTDGLVISCCKRFSVVLRVTVDNEVHGFCEGEPLWGQDSAGGFSCFLWGAIRHMTPNAALQRHRVVGLTWSKTENYLVFRIGLLLWCWAISNNLFGSYVALWEVWVVTREKNYSRKGDFLMRMIYVMWGVVVTVQCNYMYFVTYTWTNKHRKDVLILLFLLFFACQCVIYLLNGSIGIE